MKQFENTQSYQNKIDVKLCQINIMQLLQLLV